MDSLTKKILFDSGLYPGNPLLPRVNNVGMVYIKEPMLKQAEMDLFDARVALRDFEEAIKSTGLTASFEELKEENNNPPDGEDEDDKKKRHDTLHAWNNFFASLGKLEKAEAQYFVKRYGAGLDGYHRKALQGWVVKPINDLIVSGTRKVREKFDEITKGTGGDAIKQLIKFLDIWKSAVESGSATETNSSEMTSLYESVWDLPEDVGKSLNLLLNRTSADVEHILKGGDMAAFYKEQDIVDVSGFVEYYF